MTVQFALPAAVGYGVADFAGGLATRRTSATLAVIAAGQFAGAAALLPALLLLPGRPSALAAGVGALAGLAGSCGLVLYFRGLARGPMGLVAPLSALTSAGLPLLVGVLSGERIGPITVGGIAVALLAIPLATAGVYQNQATARGPLLGLASGVGFGLFFVALDATAPDSGLWPLLAAKVAPVVVFGSLVLARRGCGEAPWTWWGLIVLSGTADMLANILFLLATRDGALSVSAVLVSLYPVVVVVLARLVLRERLTWRQATSVALALTASALLSG
ncbi:MAG TPA: EamA family transporter [Pseudonocardiaceae bacterium]|nr:EamA family transporter [Pseudonocardiaceae bacterium]